MRTLVHLSDIHFGRIDQSILGPLIETVHEVKPDVVAVSGDLTQRARSAQFMEARAFLDQLPKPQIVVPGNHDVPLYNVFARFLTPLEKYRRHIGNDLQPFYADSEMIVLGVNTARSLTFKGGRINETQVAWLRERLCELDDRVVKIVVSHHPFDVPEGFDSRALVGRARMAIGAIAECGADLFLAGHLHIGHTGPTAKRYKISGYSALVVQAGTATSTRGRGEVNSFNVIFLDHPKIVVKRMEWQPEKKHFALGRTEEFEHTPEGWARRE
jgi:3',5'-cyclic AMP phosphodiesterase CpdA